MPDFNAPSLSIGLYLMDFAKLITKIRLEQGRAEAAYAGFAIGQSQQTNASDSVDPNAARIVLDAGHKRILISQVKTQLEFDFRESELPLSQQLDAVEKNATDFHRRTVNDFAVSDYRLNALIVDIQYPSPSAPIELQEYLYKCFFKSPPILPVASAQCQIGYLSGSNYINIAANAYETRRLDISVDTSQPEQVVARQAQDLELLESGVAFRIDVNNRPRLKEPGYKLTDHPGDLFEMLRDFLRKEFFELTGLHVDA